jgi:hypothetical protein
MVDLALLYFDSAIVDLRLQELIITEAEIVAKLPYRPALH